jgi:hypothetical protein
MENVTLKTDITLLWQAPLYFLGWEQSAVPIAGLVVAGQDNQSRTITSSGHNNW